MRSGADRQMPRCVITNLVELTWNIIAKGSRLRRKAEESSTALVRDLALEGALVEVPGCHVLHVGSVIDVRLGGQGGHVVIRHCTETPGVGVRYGVRFIPEPAFQSCVK